MQSIEQCVGFNLGFEYIACHSFSSVQALCTELSNLLFTLPLMQSIEQCVGFNLGFFWQFRAKLVPSG